MKFSFLLASLLASGNVFAAGSAFAAGPLPPREIKLDVLHRSYEKHDRSPETMPEFKKELIISGAVVDVSEGFTGRVLLKVAAPGEKAVLARLTAYDGEEERRMKAFKPRQPFRAVCVFQFSSGPEMSLTDCVFQ